MIWFGNLLAAIALLAPVPEGLTARVRSAIAAVWHLDPARVRVQWGTMPIRAQLTDEMPFRLAGKGQDGRYVALVGTHLGELAVMLRAGVEDSTWVASRPIDANATLAAEDVKREVRMVWGPGTSGKPSPIGWEAQRSLRAGEALTAPAIREPAQVVAGSVIRFEWSQGAIAIVREAIASNRARTGETVWAKDKVSGERLSGVVVGLGRARLTTGGTR